MAKLNLEYPCIAIKFCFEVPDCQHYNEDKIAFCEFMKYAQTTKKHFYIEAEDDACYGKLAMGMIDKPPVTAYGQAGYDFGCYITPIGCQKLYQKMPTLVPNTIHYVEYCPAEDCNFTPDLLFFVADIEKSDIIMRATSYISGDLWESVSSPVVSCSWMYAYPVISGKVNHITTGYYHGLKRRKAYPAGLRMISIPFGKHPEFFRALEEMDWTLIAFREDEESREELKKRMNHWYQMAESVGSHVDLK